MDKYEQTFETWNKVAGLYQEKFMDLELYNDTYDQFCQLLENGAPVLELGCGPGNITRYLLMKRTDLMIDATDVAPAMVKLAQKNNPAAHCSVLDVRDMGSLQKGYDGIVAGFCLPYLSKEDFDRFLVDCKARLPTNGVLYVSYILGDYEKSGFYAASTGDKTFVYFYDEAYVRGELEKYGFEIINFFVKERGTERDLVVIGRQ